MIAVKPHLTTDTVAFFDYRENIGGVLPERAGHPVNTAAELFVPHKLWSEGAPKRETFVKEFRDQALVGVVPHVFVECANDFLLRC